MGAEGQMERSRFLGALTAASIGVALQGSLKSARSELRTTHKSVRVRLEKLSQVRRIS